MEILKEVTFELGLKACAQSCYWICCVFLQLLNKVFLPVELMVKTCVSFLWLHNTLPQTWWLKTIHIYHLTISVGQEPSFCWSEVARSSAQGLTAEIKMSPSLCSHLEFFQVQVQIAGEFSCS